MNWTHVFLVGMGGFFGSICRYLIYVGTLKWSIQPFPIGTFLVNIIGCFLIGIIYGLAEKGDVLNSQWRLLLGTGFCGGFTTFSTFAYENLNLASSKEWGIVLTYTSLSVLAGFALAWAGRYLIHK